MFRRVFMQGGPKERLAFGLAMNLLRMTDLAIREYTLGREAILNYANDSHKELQLGSAIRSSAHFEICIDALKRNINLIKAIKSNPNVPLSLKDNFPRGTKLLSGDAERKISTMRHAIQHLDERIMRGEIKEGESFALQPMNKTLELGKFSIQYVELNEWLQEAYILAEKVASYQEDQDKL